MIILTKENILSYIKEHVPSLQLKEPVKVSMIGDGDLGEDVEGDGYCNYVFRVSDADGNSYIVKQSTEQLKRRGRALTPTRNRFEYEIMELRAKIVPQYVPSLYLGDPENNVFIMEDVSNLKLIRFQMNKNHLFPELAKQGAQYLAATHFYTSEHKIEDFPGRVLEIEKIDAKDLKKEEKYNIVSKNYPLKPEEIKKKYKLNDGGNHYLIFTQSVHGKEILRSQ